jgi:hypothetical protein
VPHIVRTAAAALATAGLLLAGSSSASAAAPDGKNTSQRVVAAAGQHWNQHPGDYAGLAEAISNAGGDSVRFSFPDSGLTDLTGAEAQKLVDEARSTGQAKVRTQNKITAIPISAFAVSSSWYHVQAQDGEWWNFNGNWNFQDTYLVGSTPDDAAGVATANMPSACFRIDTDTFFAAKVRGEDSSSAGYRMGADYDSVVYGVRDRNVSHVMNVDHGTVTVSYKRKTSGCSLSQARGNFFYEHNTGRSSGWSFSISIGVLSLSYSTPPSEKLQKATGVDYLS